MELVGALHDIEIPMPNKMHRAPSQIPFNDLIHPEAVIIKQKNTEQEITNKKNRDPFAGDKHGNIFSKTDLGFSQ